MADELNWKQRALYSLMSDISEECYCAGWVSGTEFTLWAMVADPNESRNWGMGTVEESQIDDLRDMANEIGGWIRWHDDHDEPDLEPSEWGPRFEPMALWLERFAKEEQERAKVLKMLGGSHADR